MTSEAGPVEREAGLEKLRRRIRRAARRGDAAGSERLRAEYAELKAAHVARSHEERREEVRARRAAVRAVEGQRRRVWRLPREFSSPLAVERARTGWQERREPVRPAYGLRPWRQESPMQRQLWRP